MLSFLLFQVRHHLEKIALDWNFVDALNLPTFSVTEVVKYSNEANEIHPLPLTLILMKKYPFFLNFNMLQVQFFKYLSQYEIT